MQIVLFRHAEKDHSGFLNPALSSFGKAQALKLRELALENKLPRPTKLMSSKKLRAQETLRPLSEAVNLSVEAVDDLDERQEGESKRDFDQRVRAMLAKLEEFTGHTVYVVSHLDWIEEALIFMNTDIDVSAQYGYAWKPAQYIEFDVTDRLWKFVSAGHVGI